MTAGQSVTPVGAVLRGMLAGAVGTAAMGLVWFARYRRGGGDQGLLAWETAEGVEKWDDASAPGQLGKRVVEKITHRELPDRWARTTTNVVHWVTGVAWGAPFGLVTRTSRGRRWTPGLAFGPVVWLTGYIVMPLAGLYQPIWEYDAKTLGKDLSAHLVYGAATGASFAALTR